MPLGGEPGFDLGRLVGLRQIPQHQRVVEVVADKAVTLESLVGVPRGNRQVAGGHPDGQGAGSLPRGWYECDADADSERRRDAEQNRSLHVTSSRKISLQPLVRAGRIGKVQYAAGPGTARVRR